MFPILINTVSACVILIIADDWVVALSVATYAVVYRLYNALSNCKLVQLKRRLADEMMRSSRISGDTFTNFAYVKTQGFSTVLTERYMRNQDHVLDVQANYNRGVATARIIRVACFTITCVFHAKPNADSTAKRAPIPRQTEQGFHDCPSANSTRNRAVRWRDGDADNHGTLDDFVGR